MDKKNLCVFKKRSFLHMITIKLYKLVKKLHQTAT